MVTSVLGVFICSFTFRSSVALMGSHPKKLPANDPGVQSGQETQFLFSEGDVRDSETDLVSRRVLGENFPLYPRFPLSLCENILLAVRPFLL